jgi:hypothetical protein
VVIRASSGVGVGPSGSFLDVLVRTGGADGSRASSLLGHVSVTEEVHEEGNKGRGKGDGRSGSLVVHGSDTAVVEHDETMEEQVLRW